MGIMVCIRDSLRDKGSTNYEQKMNFDLSETWDDLLHTYPERIATQFQQNATVERSFNPICAENWYLLAELFQESAQ